MPDPYHEIAAKAKMLDLASSGKYSLTQQDKWLRLDKDMDQTPDWSSKAAAPTDSGSKTSSLQLHAPIQVSEVEKDPLDRIVIEEGNSTNKNTSSSIVVHNDEYEYKEVDDGLKSEGEKGVIKHFMNGKAKIAVKDAFPKLIHLNAQTDINALGIAELQ